MKRDTSRDSEEISVLKKYKISDIDQMPGLFGCIVRDILSRSVRAQPLIAIQAALQTIGAIAASKGVKPPNDNKLNIITLSVALSMSGKDKPMSYMQDVLRRCKIGFYNGVSSDKDIILNLAHDKGLTVYSIDEVDSLFSKMVDTRNTFNAGIANTLLSTFTATSLSMNGKHKREIEAAFQAEEKRIKKDCSDDGMPGDGYQQSEEWKNLQNTITYIKEGMQNPQLFLHGATTPKAIDWIANEEFADRGFLGRTILFRCPEERPDARESIKRMFTDGPKAEDNDLMEQLEKKKKFMTPCRASIDNAAMDFLYTLIDWQEDRINDVDGVLVCRMMEIIGRLATIIAAGDTQSGGSVVIKEIHLQWAFTIFYRSYTDMKNMISINSEDNGFREKVMSRIVQIANNEGVYISAIEQKFKAKKWNEGIEQVFHWSGMGKDFGPHDMPNHAQKITMIVGAFLQAAVEEGTIRIEGNKVYRLND